MKSILRRKIRPRNRLAYMNRYDVQHSVLRGQHLALLRETVLGVTPESLAWIERIRQS